MGTCEMCGAQGDLQKARVEGATLKLCEDCRDVGETVDAGSASQQTASGGGSSRPREGAPDEELVPSAAADVKAAREDRGLSVTELADELKEKDSVVKRVEAGKLTPDKQLARKLEKALDIELYQRVGGGSVDGSTATAGGQTIGDVADVRKTDGD